MLALGVAIAAVGIVKITDDSFSYSMERCGPIEIDPQTSGLVHSTVLPLPRLAVEALSLPAPHLHRAGDRIHHRLHIAEHFVLAEA